ncbi:DUF262 domain-containing protein [uncultured Aquimarina sp.]|uniref:DUF262 domain-containing protein n=1 Tax=uncultured Aquimarina sp. TaxID=575652 RepID=UPI00262961F8|nr:DUF262 domain-containing protein [uncultured Aquimarina sp.]
MTEAQIETIETQIREKQQTVDYDVKEYPVEILVSKYKTDLETDENEIFIPAYQRSFVWEEERQSKFVESILLGLPIPYIFTAENEDGRLEIVDGSQRIRTLENFLSDRLTLSTLEILDTCNGLRFSDFPTSRKRKINNTSLRMIVLSEHSDEDARFMLFERINSGSVILKDMEKRKGSFTGPFTDFVYECASDPQFLRLTSFTERTKKRGEPQELILRFFAYSESLADYTGYVNEFLNDYNKTKNETFNRANLETEFKNMLNYVEANFENGFLKGAHHTSTPRVRFEAIAVGINLALKENPNPTTNVNDWLNSEEFIAEVTGSSTNTPVKLRSRINFVKNRVLGL